MGITDFYILKVKKSFSISYLKIDSENGFLKHFEQFRIL
jgi:hypothetical protein